MRFVKPTWLHSLSFKLMLSFILGVVLSIFFVSLAVFWLMIAQSQNFASEDVASFTEDMSKSLQFDANGMPFGLSNDGSDDDNNVAWLFEGLKQETAYRVLDEFGHIALISSAGEVFWSSDKSSQRLKPKKFKFKHNGSLILGATAPVIHDGKIWYFQLAVSQRFHYLIHQRVALPLMGMSVVLFSVVLLFVFGLCAYVALAYALKPLRNISKFAADISPRSFGTRLSTDKIPTEVVPLVSSFNSTLDRLEKGYRTQQEFLATAAHELKTPLALIRAQIELNEKSDDREVLLNDIAHMSRQVQQLLLLAEVSEARNYSVVTVDIIAVVHEVALYLGPMAKAAHVDIVIAYDSEVFWQADSAALFTLLKNLLENAIQHAPPATKVRVEITFIELTVRDWGLGVEAFQLPEMFIRFWRGLHRRDTGAGLGLSICQEIALAHGWILSAYRAEPGLRFHLSQSL